MAPFLHDALQPLPNVEARQADAESSPYQITLTITHPTTTYTTIINLGSAATPNSNNPTTAPVPSITSSSPSPASPTTSIATPQNEHSDSGLVAGALIGSICGFLLLVVIFYKCCINNRSAVSTGWYGSWEGSEYSSEGGSYVRRRGGDANWYGRSSIRKPRRARVRYESGYSGSSGSRSRRVGVSSVRTTVNRDGMMGWYWKPKAKYEYAKRTDKWDRNIDSVDD